MTDGSAPAIADLDDDTLRTLLNIGASFACLQVAADVMEKGNLDDDETAAIGELPIGVRTHMVARILDATEAIREELRQTDGRLLILTSGQHGATAT